MGLVRIVRRNQHLLRAGDAIAQPWLVVAGTFKRYQLYAEGEEQILDFHGPGDIIGLEAMVRDRADCSIVALETCSVRPLSTATPAGACAETDPDARRILEGMYQEVVRLRHRLYMSFESTDQRLAGFLLEFSETQRRSGLKPLEFRLPMRRRDLALYLGLATETLSRTFSRLRSQGLVDIDNREIRILDVEGLRAFLTRR